jgi:hypothetical protein
MRCCASLVCSESAAEAAAARCCVIKTSCAATALCSAELFVFLCSFFLFVCLYEKMNDV